MKYSPYSYTKMKCFAHCKFKFALKYIQKIKLPPLDQRFFEKGRFYHWFIENYPASLTESYVFKHTSEDDQKRYLETVRNFLEGSEENLKLLNSKLGNEVEFKFNHEFDVTFSSKWNSCFYGYIDYLAKSEEPNAIMSIDWKSKKHANFPNDKEQLLMYSIWLFQVRPKLQKVISQFRFVEDSDVEEHIFLRENFEEEKKRFINNIDTIESEKNFEKNITKECEKCDYFQHCKPFNISIKVKK